jgi:hypothetical protein
MDKEELEYAMDLYNEQKKDKTKACVESDEDESYRPSPEVELSFSFLSCLFFVTFIFQFSHDYRRQLIRGRG